MGPALIIIIILLVASSSNSNSHVLRRKLQLAGTLIGIGITPREEVTVTDGTYSDRHKIHLWPTRHLKIQSQLRLFCLSFLLAVCDYDTRPCVMSCHVLSVRVSKGHSDLIFH